MRNLFLSAAIAVLSAGAIAQDKITLTNGDVLTGKITTMADGKVTLASPLLEDVVIPMTDISDMVTEDQVTLRTKSGDLWQRRIIGIEGGGLRLEGGQTSELSLDNLGMINPPEDPPAAWAGALKFTGVNSTGNTERRSAGLAIDAVRTSEIDRLSFDASWDYAENKPANSPSGTPFTLVQRRTGAGIKYDYFLTQRSYLLVTSRVLGDTIANLDLRFSAGAGFGYTLIKDSKSLFLLEAGLSYFSESYRIVTPPNPSSTNFLAARIAYRYERKLTEHTSLVHRAEAFPSLENSDDFYCQVTSELTTLLTESMIASLTHVLDYDNTPAPGFKRADNRVVLSVGWNF